MNGDQSSADASTLDLSGVEPRVQQLGEGYQSEDLVSSAYRDPMSNRESSMCSCPVRSLAWTYAT